MNQVHNFQDSLKVSHDASDMPEWEIVYRKAFPTFVAMVDHRENGDHQKAGIDRSVILSNSKQLLIDEKVRTKNYGDIALEFISNDQRQTPGWVCKPLLADYIAYMIRPSRICYILPVVQLQAAWESRGIEWRQTFGVKAAQNEGYKTLNCCVPPDRVFSAIGFALRIKY